MIVQQYSTLQRAIDVLLKPACVGASAYFLSNIDSGTDRVTLWGYNFSRGQFYSLQAVLASLAMTPISQYVFDNHMKHHARFKEISKNMLNIGVHAAITAFFALQYANKSMTIPLIIAVLSEVIGEYANQAVLPMV